MKAALLFTASGPIVILTSYASITDPALLDRLAGKGINKFLAYEVPISLAEERYGGHFRTVLHDLHESDDLRVVDYNGHRALALFRFDELKGPVVHESS